MLPYLEKVFPEVLKDYPGLSGWVHYKCHSEREAKRQHRGESLYEGGGRHWNTQAKENGSSHQKLEGAKDSFSPKAPRRRVALPDFRFLAPEL